MKRFYCTVCKRVKRVRKYPTNVVGPTNQMPVERVGECTYHTSGHVRTPKTASFKRVKITKTQQTSNQARKSGGR